MLVKLKTSLVWGGVPHHNEEEIDLPDNIGQALIRTNQAEAVANELPPSAGVDEVETAMLQQPKTRGPLYERTKATRRTS